MLYIIGNIKMNLSLKDYKPYLKGVNKVAKASPNYVGLALPYPYLYCAQKSLKNVHYGAQNVYVKDKGAYTGEVSAKMLTDFGCDLCLVGHSERRAYFNESGEDINSKIVKLLENNITPVLCFGETKEQRDNGKTKYVIKEQLKKALDGINNINKIIFAYEPVWAIGTGVTPTTMQIAQISTYIKDLLEKMGAKREGLKLLYGGSVNENNASDIFKVADIDGGLIGGACLDVTKFEKIINCTK